jgi:3-dehydroquinate synthase
MSYQSVHSGSLIDFSKQLNQLVNNHKVFIICDSNTQICFKTLEENITFKTSYKLQIDAGEENKNINQVLKIWEFLNANNANKNDWIINIGGGMICDLGGFAASTFKRGISFVNIPTSLLAMVDAAIGGKTGFNFHGLKNNIGTFYPAKMVVCDAIFLNTLPVKELKSGFAEVIKHALICDSKFWYSIKTISFKDYDFQEIIESSIVHKLKIVESDPKENGPRKKLNFGHTVGHALESHALQCKNPILHGYAVAQGMVIESYISYKLNYISKEKFKEIKEFIFSIYPPIHIENNKIETMVNFMINDKKNKDSKINFTLLNAIGSAVYDQYLSAEETVNLIYDFYKND